MCSSENLQNPNEYKCCVEIEECMEYISSEIVIEEVESKPSYITQHSGFSQVFQVRRFLASGRSTLKKGIACKIKHLSTSGKEEHAPTMHLPGIFLLSLQQCSLCKIPGQQCHTQFSAQSPCCSFLNSIWQKIRSKLPISSSDKNMLKHKRSFISSENFFKIHKYSNLI